LLVLKDPPDEQPFTGDRVDDETVPVGERVSGSVTSWWSFSRATIRSPAEARAPAASGAERSRSTRPRWIRSSRMIRLSSRQSSRV